MLHTRRFWCLIALFTVAAQSAALADPSSGDGPGIFKPTPHAIYLQVPYL